MSPVLEYPEDMNPFGSDEDEETNFESPKVSTPKTSTPKAQTPGKEIEIVHRLSLVRISYCVGTCRVKQKRKQTKVFTNHVGGFVDSYSGSCSK